jgi:hypothetical protein
LFAALITFAFSITICVAFLSWMRRAARSLAKLLRQSHFLAKSGDRQHTAFCFALQQLSVLGSINDVCQGICDCLSLKTSNS